MDYQKCALQLKINQVEITRINVKEIDKMSELRDYGIIVDETAVEFTL
jgi:hypothetical protein